MKACLMVMLVVVSLWSGVAMADRDASPDQICIIFDYQSGCHQNCGYPAFGAAFDAYVVLQNSSDASGVSGFEFRPCNEGGGSLVPPAGQYVVAEFELPAGAVSLADPPDFVVGLGIPLDWSPCILLLTIHMRSSGSNDVPWCFGVQPVSAPMIPGRMAYAGTDDPTDLHVMHPCTGPQADSCFLGCVNSPSCPPPTANERTTWGGLKALYR